jgi:hypothetical protein
MAGTHGGARRAVGGGAGGAGQLAMRGGVDLNAGGGLARRLQDSLRKVLGVQARFMR